MNKAELIAKVAEKTGRTQTDVKTVVEAIFGGPSITGVLAERLYQEEEIAIAGFGKFGTKKREAHTGRNPSTGDAIEIPEKNAVFFKPSKELKEYVQD